MVAVLGMELLGVNEQAAFKLAGGVAGFGDEAGQSGGKVIAANLGLVVDQLQEASSGVGKLVELPGLASGGDGEQWGPEIAMDVGGFA